MVQRHWVAVAIACGCFGRPYAQGEIEFVQVQASVGLNHSVLYAPFSFPNDPPQVAQIKRVMQRNMGNGAAVGDYDNDGDPDIYLLGQLGFCQPPVP